MVSRDILWAMQFAQRKQPTNNKFEIFSDFLLLFFFSVCVSVVNTKQKKIFVGIMKIVRNCSIQVEFRASVTMENADPCLFSFNFLFLILRLDADDPLFCLCTCLLYDFSLHSFKHTLFLFVRISCWLL